MAGGGKRPGAGRPKGSKNRTNMEREAEVQASGLTPLEFMLSRLRDEAMPMEVRQWAAEKAAPYVHPRLAQIEAETKSKVDATMTVTWLPPQS